MQADQVPSKAFILEIPTDDLVTASPSKDKIAAKKQMLEQRLNRQPFKQLSAEEINSNLAAA